MMSCSTCAPSELANSFHSPSPWNQEKQCLIPGTLSSAPLIVSSRSDFSASGILNGFRSSGVCQVSTAALTGASCTGRCSSGALALAISTASWAARSAAAGATCEAALKPQAPPAITRTPSP